MEEHKEGYKCSYVGGNKRWRYPIYGYTSDNHADRDFANEKDNIAVSRTMQEDEGA
jgi:hypothetical protein